MGPVTSNSTLLLTESEKELASPDDEEYWTSLESWTKTWSRKKKDRRAPERTEKWAKQRRNDEIRRGNRRHQVGSLTVSIWWIGEKKQVVCKTCIFMLWQKEGRPSGLDVPGPSWPCVKRWVSSGTSNWQTDHRSVWGAWKWPLKWDWSPARVHLQSLCSSLHPWPGCQDPGRPPVCH